MPSSTNYYAFCADYSDMAACLFAIQASLDNGSYNNDPVLLQMIRVFEQDSLRTLYIRTITILQKLDGVYGLTTLYLPGDFTDQDFYNKDFDDGYLKGDFADDYSDTDYDTGFLDLTNTGFSSTFKTIINIFGEFVRHIDEISESDIIALDTALIAVINYFTQLQAYLTANGENPCLPTQPKYYNNSPDLFLQAAGADGTDGVAAGIHLRWAFAGELAANHLAKGEYDNNTGNTSFYNQPDDYLYLSRTPYINPFRITIDFSALSPIVNYQQKQWSYVINTAFGDDVITNRVTITFEDADAYDQLAAAINTASDYFNLLTAYPETIAIEISNKSMFVAALDLGDTEMAAGNICKIEGLCTGGYDLSNPESAYARRTILLEANRRVIEELSADNMKSIKVKKSAGTLLNSFAFETYDDFINSRAEQDWSEISTGFSLSVSQNEVFQRLETTNYPIDHLWPQYNDGTTVKVSNYHDKWGADPTDETSLLGAVSQYLILSETDPRAMLQLLGTSLSCVDMINLVSTDYHIARMLGLGHIDTTADDASYVYRIKYTNRTSLQDATSLTRSYLTLPTTRADSRLPDAPQAKPVVYGTIPAESAPGIHEDGYMDYIRARMINVGRLPFNDEVDGYDFFADLSLVDNTNIFTRTRPIFYGIEHRLASSSTFVKPEITGTLDTTPQYFAYDPDFPVDGIPETIVVMDNQPSLFTHFEKEEGVHYYALYGVNWFSRVSAVGNEVATDDTLFLPLNFLQPPTDVAVQYVQPEQPLLFTTSVEQEWLADRQINFPGQDIYFTRVVFNWIDIVDVTTLARDYGIDKLATIVRPDSVNVWFDPQPPVSVEGTIAYIVPVVGSDVQIDLFVDAYTQLDGTIVSPTIESSDFFRFNNSLLSTINGQYQVVSVGDDNDRIVIRVSKNTDPDTIENPDAPGSYGFVQNFISPPTGSRFTMVENLGNQANWDAVNATVSLHSFTDIQHADIVELSDSEGNITGSWIGGVSVSNAQITPMPEDLDAPGFYDVVFSGYTLDPHPQINLPSDPSNAPGSLHQAHVEWYKGWLRADRQAGGDDKKLVEVSRIVSLDPLHIVIYDPTYQDDPIVLSTPGAEDVTVNFHPGYRCYLFAEPAPHAFNGTNIMPSDGQVSRKTMIGLQTADSRPGGSGFASKVSLPAILLARDVQIPVQFDRPSALSAKVRPDATWRAALTYDSRIAPAADNTMRRPFGFKFCRTTDEDVLDALYLPETVASINIQLAKLPFFTIDYNNRFSELVNVVTDDIGHFNIFGTDDQAYGFPVPDQTAFDDPPSPAPPLTIEQKKALYASAIAGTILPLTAQVPILDYIKPGKQTSNNQPVIYDQYGDYLAANDPRFDAFPMIRQYPDPANSSATFIRFTDYSLNASSRRLYFYASAEVTNQLVAGPLSEFAGPVMILNTIPPEAPVVQNFSLIPSQTGNSPLSVDFQLLPFAPYDNISSVRFYRTTDKNKSNSLLTMTASPKILVGSESLTGLSLTDDFSDMSSAPVGLTTYYRIVAVRVIDNEFEELEDVISIGSDVAVVTLVDTLNPQAPQLTYTRSTNTLSWTPVINNGTYYVYQQNAKGNWTLLNAIIAAPANVEIDYVLPNALQPVDENGNTIYNRFKVKVQNGSGLLNLSDNELTV